MRRKRVKRTPIAKSERPKPPVHTGHLVWRYLIDTKQPRALLAKETNRSLTTISRQLRKPSLQVAELFEFCNVVKHNFFEDLAQKLPPEYSTAASDRAKLHAEMEEKIHQLLEENERLKAENKKLDERLDLLLRKL